MTYRVHVAVLLAVPELWSKLPRSENDWHDAVSYYFGINANGPAEAVHMAVDAARNAVGREGEFIGGVVIEAHCRRVDAKEFEESKEYFHQPMNQSGIFYVTGTTSYQISNEKTREAAAELEILREEIRLSGLPAPSFIHPQLPETPPYKVRLLCNVCQHWMETDNLDIMYSFMGGLETFSAEELELWRERRGAAGWFVRRHLSECFEGFAPGFLGIRAIHKDDPLWSTLDEEKREEPDEV